MRENDHDYLWDRRGPADPEIAGLEEALAPFRYRPAARADLEPPRGRGAAPPARRWLEASAAAAIALAAVLFGIAPDDGRAPGAARGWTVEWLAGAPAATRLEVGAWLETAAEERARIAVADIGFVEVAPHSRVRLADTGPRAHRLEMQRGSLHARITAPPRLFFVDTPAATAVDLGCEYSFTVDRTGAGLLRVSLGYVQLEAPGRAAAFVPREAECRSQAGLGPGVPYFEDAAPALRDLDPANAEAVSAALGAARPRDSLTLWHLLSRSPAALVPAVRARLLELAPPPASIRPEELARAGADALEAWRDHMRWTYWYE
ncbi:MAG: FecR domain-containing protein [Planctomycetes bacterium]|nr:FecR domain-containing protein [Planctomycetota bacterium]